MIEVHPVTYVIGDPDRRPRHNLRVEHWVAESVWVITDDNTGNYLRRDTHTLWNGYDGATPEIQVEKVCGFPDRQEALARAVSYLEEHP